MPSEPAPSPRRLVVLDLDGTVAVGDEPVLHYLRAMAGVSGDAAFGSWAATGDGFRDGYALAAAWAAEHEVPEADRSAAYAASRAALHDGLVDVAAPDGLAAALDRRPGDVRVVLVTNAPVDGVGPLLERLGMAGRLDALVGDAGKPAGMPAALSRLLVETGLEPEALLSVGDVWENDLAPAAAIGSATAFVDRFLLGEGDPTFRARTLTELLPDLERWWAA